MPTTQGKTIVLWGQEDVLIRAVEDLLDIGCDWRMIRISDVLDEASLARAMADITPDVLIVHQEALRGDMRLLVNFIQEYSQLRIIKIGLENNLMEIYNKKRVCIKESSDLLAAIQNSAASDT